MIRCSVLFGLVSLFAAGRAQAQNACTTDTDCPNAACGGDVCTHSSGVFTCNAANTQGRSGFGDGWCADAAGNADDSKCKCRGMGAFCDGLFCSFTVPPTGTGGSGAGGSTGTGGSGGSGGGTAGSSGGTGTGGGDSGCSVGGAPALGGSAGLVLLLAALIRGSRRRA